MASARRHADTLALRIGTDIDTSRCALAMTIGDVARRAHVAPSTVVRVIHGDGGAHLDTVCAVAAAVGLSVGAKVFPSAQPSLRDTGQLRLAEFLVGQGDQRLRAALELPVGDAFGRAADLVFFGADEIIHAEIERRLPDFQAPYRAATVKRDALQAKHSRPVRLVLVIEDTRRNRALVAPHGALIRGALPATSSDILRALRNGTPLGHDGLLWVRPWRMQHARTKSIDESRS